MSCLLCVPGPMVRWGPAGLQIATRRPIEETQYELMNTNKPARSAELCPALRLLLVFVSGTGARWDLMLMQPTQLDD